MGSAGCENPALPVSPRGLHVIQRAAAPAREPRPVIIDVVASAVCEACVKHLPPATTGFTGVCALFRAGSTLFFRLLAFFFRRP